VICGWWTKTWAWRGVSCLQVGWMVWSGLGWDIYIIDSRVQPVFALCHSHVSSGVWRHCSWQSSSHWTWREVWWDISKGTSFTQVDEMDWGSFLCSSYLVIFSPFEHAWSYAAALLLWHWGIGNFRHVGLLQCLDKTLCMMVALFLHMASQGWC